jgi:hypothetical protein
MPRGCTPRTREAERTFGVVTLKPATKSSMRLQYRIPASRDAAAERRAQAERDAGIPDRTDADCRQPIALDLSSVCAISGHRHSYTRRHARCGNAARHPGGAAECVGAGCGGGSDVDIADLRGYQTPGILGE